MKEGFDKEIDSLLRRRARGVAAASFGDGDGAGAAASSHLDADELGAFAEGALPAPARLAAASHLADCDRCRGVAVALSRALGGGAESKPVAAVPASTAAKEPAAWRAWVAAVFSPRAMRFAAPALALSVVAVVSYVALRTRQGGALDNTQSARPQAEVAQVQPGSAAPSTAATNANVNTEGLVVQNPEESSANHNASGTAPRPSSEGRGPSAAEPPQPVTLDSVTVTAEDTAAPPSPPPAPAAIPDAPPEIAKAPSRPAPAEESEQPSKSDGQDKAKSARDAAGEVAENEYSVNQRNRAAQNRAGEVQMPDGSRAQRRDTNLSNVYGNNAGTSAAPKEPERESRGGGATASRRAARPNTRAEQKTEDSGEALRVGETREAAGHRFRREGSAWVDVKYKPNMRSTGVRRGSEAFRALVADVPVVGRVAEQIGGEVIVVVGGHAYRIR